VKTGRCCHQRIRTFKSITKKFVNKTVRNHFPI
jgi:hypothetical protein